jgi:hypothetical protein
VAVALLMTGLFFTSRFFSSTATPSTNDDLTKSQPANKNLVCNYSSTVGLHDIPAGWSVSILRDICLAVAHPGDMSFYPAGPGGSVGSGSWSASGGAGFLGLETSLISEDFAQALQGEYGSESVGSHLDPDVAAFKLPHQADAWVGGAGSLSYDYLINAVGTDVWYRVHLVGKVGDGAVAEIAARIAASATPFLEGGSIIDDSDVDAVPIRCGDRPRVTVSDVAYGDTVSLLGRSCMTLAHPEGWRFELVETGRGTARWSVINVDRGSAIGTLASWSGDIYGEEAWLKGIDSWCPDLDSDITWSGAMLEGLWVCDGGVQFLEREGTRAYVQNYRVMDVGTMNSHTYAGTYHSAAEAESVGDAVSHMLRSARPF